MNKIRIYNDEEIKILLCNNNVEKIKNKSQIVYKNEFKLWAVKEKINHIEKTARQIFEAGGFNTNILDDRTPQRRLCSWIKKFKKFGEDYFTNKNKYSYKAIDNNSNQIVSNLNVFFVEKDDNSSINLMVVRKLENEKTDNKN